MLTAPHVPDDDNPAGLRFARRFTLPGIAPFAMFDWETREVRITSAGGAVVFAADRIEVPRAWSRTAGDILASKYLRKTGVPGVDATGRPVLGAETSARQWAHRLAAAWKSWGSAGGYFATTADAEVFYDECVYMLLAQIASPNSPQHFNTGLFEAYGVAGDPDGNWYYDDILGAPVPSAGRHTRSAANACYILSVADDLTGPGGIMDLITREARLFKAGAGSGANFSAIRAAGEPLSGGGTSSGLMSFLKVADTAAGAIKSGGTTRRAAKMVIVDVDHPDIQAFIDSKIAEEAKAGVLIGAGYDGSIDGDAYGSVAFQNANHSVRVTDAFMEAVAADAPWHLRRGDGTVAKTVRAADLWQQIARASWTVADPGVQFHDTINAWHTAANDGPIRGSNPCFPAGERVATDAGLIGIGELVERGRAGEDFAVYTNNLTAGLPAPTAAASTPTRYLATGHNDVVELRFSDGSRLRCTPNHRLWTAAGRWVTAADLGADDLVVKNTIPCPRTRPDRAVPGTDEPWTATLGYILGRLSAAEPAARETLLPSLIHHYSDPGQWFRDGAALAKTERQAIMTAPEDAVCAWLLGLFDAAGDVDTAALTVRLHSRSEELLLDVQETFGALGMHAVVEPHRGGHLLTVADVHRFADLVGFSDELRESELEAVLPYAPHPPALAAVSLAARTRLGRMATFNLTEPVNHSYIAAGVVVANCSEYMYLDDTACNLASINLARFHDSASGRFDADGYAYAVRLWTTVLEITVAMSHYPSADVAARSFEHRTLGLGFTNLGALLMLTGTAYDSDEGRAVMAGMAGLLTMGAWAASTELAEAVGPAPAYGRNAEHVKRVLANHRRAVAAYLDPAPAGLGDFEGLPYTPVCFRPADGLPAAFDGLLDAAAAAADRAVTRCSRFGVRNMQVSVLAPTGTISLVMDADTTGIEPDFALVKSKRLVGGGTIKIVNRSVGEALRALGYTDAQTDAVLTHVAGTATLHGPTPVNAASLTAAGLPAAAVDRIQDALPAAFDLRHAVTAGAIGAEAMDRLHLPAGPGADLLPALGFTAADIAASNTAICGHHTVEGAPGLDPAHLAVFDTATTCGDGTRAIGWSGHVKALGAVAPLLSGSASKTVNLPAHATVEEFAAVHDLAWHLGVKSVALYRDGSKLAQPLTAKTAAPAGQWPDDSPTARYAGGGSPRFALPDVRFGPTWRFQIEGQEVRLHAGEYEDGTLGEISIEFGRDGSPMRALLSSLSTAVSHGLQHGVLLDDLAAAMVGQGFDPRGPVTGHANLKMAASVVDAVFRILSHRYLDRADLVHVPGAADETAAPADPPGLPATAALTGELCTACGGPTRIAGTCRVCASCGESTSCG